MNKLRDAIAAEIESQFPDMPTNDRWQLAMSAEYQVAQFIYNRARREGYTAKKVR